ncbi:hypothetical protein G114_09484 [Aeromonas diversa CDC 2478-85]|uniref:Uncharacterized protein n=1 Tax=Aeromonas diversa CDC 2478-85 TaxID=1268237 RepID=N9VL83_9GAMM|nr:hypothetical protein G114_09484 [Aeromonas diversa CDC 2478-85]
MGYLAGHWQEFGSASIIEVQQKTLALQSEGLTRLKKELEVKQTQLTTQQTAFEQLQQTIKGQEAQLQEQKRQLAFFERIMRPGTEKVGVSIDNLSIETTSVPGRFHYRLALIQAAKQRDLFRGQVVVRVDGSLEGQPKSLDGAALGMKSGATSYALRYFQLLEGDWQLPEGFVPDKVILTLPKQGKQPAQRLVVNWGEVLKPLAVPQVAPAG